jgi:8-oxo-dGTP diphosphatase
MKLIDKLAWIRLEDQQILSTKSFGKDKYYIPGGKREPGESDSEALLREIKEELSVDLLPESLQLLGVFRAQAHGHPEGVMVQMTCYTGDYVGTLQASEIAEIRWLTNAQRPEIAEVDKLIFDFLIEKKLLQ